MRTRSMAVWVTAVAMLATVNLGCAAKQKPPQIRDTWTPAASRAEAAAKRTEEAAQRAEQSAMRAETAATKVEATVSRVETAIERIEAMVSKSMRK
jgi:hypothetical protein